MSDTLRVSNISTGAVGIGTAASSLASFQVYGNSSFQTSSGANAFTVGNDSSCLVHGDHYTLGNIAGSGPSGNWSTFGQTLSGVGGYANNPMSTVSSLGGCISWNGQYVIITVGNAGYGPFYSNNGGQTFSTVSPSASSVGNFWGCAISASGQYVLISNLTNVYLSSNYLPMPLSALYSYSGYTSVLTVTSTRSALSMSASGQYAVFAYSASSTTGGIYVSSNYGVSWTLVSGTNYPWQSVSMSASGQYITACCNGTANNIYISSNWGTSYSLPTTSLSGVSGWTSVKVSASAQWQVACASNYVYYSSNYGVTWTASSMSNSLSWACVAISPSGQYVIAATAGFYANVYTNSNYGAGSWTQQTPNGAFQYAIHMAVSATGTVVCVSNGNTGFMSYLTSNATASLTPSLLMGTNPNASAISMLTVNSNNGGGTSGGGSIFLGSNYAAPAQGLYGGAGDKLILYPGSSSAYPYSIGVASSTLYYSSPATHAWYSNGTVSMYINSSGNVDIGTSNTYATLNVGANTAVNGVNMALGLIDPINNAQKLLMGTYYGGNVTTSYSWIQATQTNVANNALILQSWGGNVGIGITNPSFPLTVYGGVGLSYSTTGNNPYLISPNISVNNNTGPYGAVCGWFQHDLICGGAVGTFSDLRIKNNIEPVTNALATIDQLRMVRHGYIDQVENPQPSSFGLIAQEVSAVIPDAVSIVKNYIPNVMCVPQSVTLSGDVIEMTFEQPIDLAVNDQLRFILKDRQVEQTVLFVSDDKRLLRVTSWSNPDPIGDQIFVYGKEVDDFHILDKSKMGLLALAGVKELHQTIKSLESQLDSVLSRLSAAGL